MVKVPKISVEIVDELPSTNAALLERDSIHGVLLVARKQSQGIGRRGRTWLSPEGNFAGSLGLELSQREYGKILPWISFWLGIVAYETVLHFISKTACRELTLKWPNDLYWQGKKLAGMLVQVRHQGDQVRVVAGLGLNLSTAPEGNFSATSLKEVAESEPSLEEFLAVFTDQLQKLRFTSAEEVKEAWEVRCLHMKQEIAFETLGECKQEKGLAIALNSEGGLRVLVNGQERVLLSEEVSLFC